ncbi:hypothetical protein [Flavivirga spongiicola]|uniref:Uncharacterized protein n=1 Tax=Flavivirga spongiicola TaxID=421621 RepID=A0ABU7XV07_9FLAO|nr:hypothetical protein [Flavivirga sp. MEBiC05379]MDO5979353.1 hypothetical protein [Flavivirga sp. MEBiC05379]
MKKQDSAGSLHAFTKIKSYLLVIILSIVPFVFRALNFPILLKSIGLTEFEFNLPEILQGSDFLVANHSKGMLWLLIIGELYVLYVFIRLIIELLKDATTSRKVNKYLIIITVVGIVSGSWAYGFNLWIVAPPIFALILHAFGIKPLLYFIGTGMFAGVAVFEFNFWYIIICLSILALFFSIYGILKIYYRYDSKKTSKKKGDYTA